jgi:hypothetical protein
VNVVVQHLNPSPNVVGSVYTVLSVTGFLRVGGVHMDCAARMARWTSWTSGCWLLGALVSVVLSRITGYVVDPLAQEAMKTPTRIALWDGKLTISTMKAPLYQVMEEISQLHGTQLRWMDPDVGEEEVSVEFTALPLAEAVGRILRETNFLLLYALDDKGTQLTQIWIASRKKDGEQPVHERQPDPQVETTPIVEKPAEESAPPLDAAIQTAMSAQDLSSRMSALMYLGHHAQEDERVREILSQLSSNDHNPQVRDFASEVLARQGR